MLFGAREWFFQTASRRALSRMARCRGPTLAGAGPRALATFLRARSRLARSPLDPRSIPAQLAWLAPSLTLPVPVPVRVPVARSRSLGRSTLGSLALGRSGGRSGRRAVTRVARIACCRPSARRPPAMQRIRGITRQHARALCTCTRARDRGQDRASTPAASPSLDAGDDAPEGAEVRRRSHREQGRTSARCWGGHAVVHTCRASTMRGRGKNCGSTHAILIAPGSEQASDDLRGDGHGLDANDWSTMAPKKRQPRVDASAPRPQHSRTTSKRAILLQSLGGPYRCRSRGPPPPSPALHHAELKLGGGAQLQVPRLRRVHQ